MQGRVGSSAEEKGPAEAVASLGKPQTCWSWTLLQVPQAPGGPQRHLRGSRRVQGEKSMGEPRHLEKLHPVQPSPRLSPPQQETGTAPLRAPHFHSHTLKTTLNRLGLSQEATASNFPLSPLPHLQLHISCLARGSWAGGSSWGAAGKWENRRKFCGADHTEPLCVCAVEPFPIFPL